MESKLDRLRSHVSQLAPGENTESMLEDNSPEYTEHIATRDSRAPAVLEKLASGEELDQDELFIAEAIILPDLRPAIDIIGGDFTIDDPNWRHLDNDQGLHQSIKSTLVSIGRIDLPGHPALPYGGTGFVVGPDLIMTNRHVAELFISGLGVSGLRFQPGLSAGIDFKHELGSDGSVLLDVVSAKMIHPYWDMALLRVQGLPNGHAALRLSLDDPNELVDRDIVCVGYPAFDPRNDAAVQNQVFRGVYSVKRLQPGKVRGRGSAKSFGKAVDVGTHDSSTLGGNSGSAVIDPQTGQVLALHFAGIYLKENYAVPMCDLAKDQRVVDLGLAFADKPSPHSGAWDSWWTKTVQDGLPGRESGSLDDAPDSSQHLPVGSNNGGASVTTAGELVVRYNIPIEITVRIAGGPVATAVPGATSDVDLGAVEKMVAPLHDTNYDNRKGYDSGFLGVKDVPLPRATKPNDLATLSDGSHVIPYHHFSIVLSKLRRLPVYTACNVDYSPTKKEPEPGDYTRKGLSGLGPKDMELWFTDPRLPSGVQLSDKFFTKDKGAFDRGHVVRREDVAWGSSYQQVRDSVGDTFHITNCTPQVAGFNRPDKESNWGDLELFVAKQAAADRLSLFAGPVLATDDPIFAGVTDGGEVLRVRIPRSYWKVVAAVQDGKLATFGFILDQNLDDVPLEFAVSPEWEEHMIALSDLEDMLGYLKFPAAVKKADQAATSIGEGLRSDAGIELISDTKSNVTRP